MRKWSKAPRVLALLAALVAATVGFVPASAYAEAGSLQDQVNAATNGSTIKLDKDYTESIVIPQGKTLTLDLNGHIVTGTRSNGSEPSTVTVEGSLTVVDSSAKAAPSISADHGSVVYESGRIVCPKTTHKPWAKAVAVVKGGSFVLEGGTLEAVDSDALFVGAEGDATGSSAIINGGFVSSYEYGIGVITKSSLVVNGGVVLSKNNAAIAGNGTKGLGDVTIQVNGGSLIAQMSDSARANGYIAVGVYFPNSGNLTISGGDIYAHGGVGVAARAGEVNITGGSIVATGTTLGKVGDSKTEVLPSGVVYDGESAYPGADADSAVKISGNVVIASDPAVPAVAVQTQDTESPSRLMSVSGGTYSDTSALPFAGDNVALKGDDGFSVMTVEKAKESGAVASVTTDDGETVYFTNQKDAEEFAKDSVGSDQTPPEVTPVTYKVSFDLNGGSGTVAAQTVNAGTPAVAPSPAPNRDGYTFDGWFAPNATTPFDFSSPIMGDVTLTAKWTEVEPVVPEAKEFTVTFDDGVHDPTTVKVKDGELVAKPKDPEHDGWKFVGWFTKKAADGTVSGEWDFGKDAVTADMTLYGGWKKVEAGETEKPQNKLPQTGDASMLPILAAGGAGAAAVAAGALISKRRKAE